MAACGWAAGAALMGHSVQESSVFSREAGLEPLMQDLTPTSSPGFGATCKHEAVPRPCPSQLRHFGYKQGS